MMLKLMCLFIPSFFCILTEYIKNKITERKETEKKKKNYSKANIKQNIILYILSFITINIIMTCGLYLKYNILLWNFEFTQRFSTKYVLISSIIAIFLPFVFEKIKEKIEKIKKINKKYKILNIKINYSQNNLKKLIKDNKRITNVSMYFITGIILFYILDIYIRYISCSISGINSVFSFCPNILTLAYAFLFTIIFYYLPTIPSKIWAILTYSISLLLFIANYMMLKIKSEALSVYDLNNASEGFEFINFLLDKINIILIIFIIVYIFLTIKNYKYLKLIKKEKRKLKLKNLAISIIIFILLHTAAILSLNDYEKGAWEAITYPKYYYDNFLNPKKSLSTAGLYEYTIRDIYLYIKEKNSSYGSKEEIEQLLAKNIIEKNTNEMTGIFKDKNLIMIMLESIDSIVVNKETMPTLYYLSQNGWNFTSRYSALSSGGSTILTEYISMTGLYHNNKYYNNINNNTYPYSIPNQFAKQGYKVSSVHENKGMYYNRDQLHKSLGFQNSYFLYDILENPKIFDDSQIIENKEIYNSIISKDNKFMTFIITIAGHGPYDSTNNMCTKYKKDMTERECFNYVAGTTDNFLKLLLEQLEKDNLLDDTVLVLYTDHQAYSYNYTEQDLKEYKQIDDNYKIKNVPFIIYSKNLKPTTYDKLLVNDIDIVPTIINLFGIDYDPNNYIGTDVFSKYHKNLILFNDYSWYDGNIYSLSKDIDKSSEYYSETSNYVIDRINLSNMILSNDYYK
ncbi:MAG: sulfatase-like hydrolase/transferase [Bacilli bacterium]|nr:sulfatase-like hydrolase/transferase [Bacilli bacterium]